MTAFLPSTASARKGRTRGLNTIYKNPIKKYYFGYFKTNFVMLNILKQKWEQLKGKLDLTIIQKKMASGSSKVR